MTDTPDIEPEDDFPSKRYIKGALVGVPVAGALAVAGAPIVGVVFVGALVGHTLGSVLHALFSKDR